MRLRTVFLQSSQARMSLAAAKAAIRADRLAERDRLDPEVRAAAAARIAGRVLAMAKKFPPGPVSVYWPIRSEVDTSALLCGLHAAGRDIALPVVRRPSLMFRRWRPGDALHRAGFGLSEPLESAPAVRPATLLMPLAAFDRGCNRIGYGAGFYDRAIADLGADHPVRTIGLAFAMQEVDHVPAQAHDRVLDAVVTEDGLFGSVLENA